MFLVYFRLGFSLVYPTFYVIGIFYIGISAGISYISCYWYILDWDFRWYILHFMLLVYFRLGFLLVYPTFYVIGIF